MRRLLIMEGQMNVFDFDNTIYDGESAVDFFKYCVKQKPSLSRHLPKVAAMALKYKTGKVSGRDVADFGAYMLGILALNVKDLDKALDGFWERNASKIKKKIIALIEPGDIVLTASPSFMFDRIKDRMMGADILSTEVDIKTARIVRLCYGENKITEFKRAYPAVVPDNYYTDNFNDMPMIMFAKKAWLVEGTKITEINIAQMH